MFLDRLTTGRTTNGLRCAVLVVATVNLLSLLGAGLILSSGTGPETQIGLWVLFTTTMLTAVVHQQVMSAKPGLPICGAKGRHVSPAAIAASGVGLSTMVSAMTSIFAVASLKGLDHEAGQEERLEGARLADALAAPICILSPVNRWGLFVMGLLAVSVEDAPVFEMFLQVSLLNFYSWCIIAWIGLATLRQQRVWTKTGNTASMHNRGVRPSPARRRADAFFWLGLAVVVLSVATGAEMSTSVALLGASFLLSTVIFLSLLEPEESRARLQSLLQAKSHFNIVATSAALLFLAYLVQAIVQATGTSRVADWLGSLETLGPAFVFVLAAACGLFCGSSWLVMALFLPALAGLPEPAPLIAAAISGAILGDHAAPHSDTTLLSSAAFGVSPLDHARHQFGLVAVCGLCTAAGFTVLGALF